MSKIISLDTSYAGINEEFVPILYKAGYLTVESIKGEKPGKIVQAISEINKKYKLGLSMPSLDEVTSWTEA